MARMPRTDWVTLENIQVLPGTFRNFSGRPDTFNRQGGKRYFHISLDEHTFERLLDLGFNARELPPREGYDEPLRLLKVNISYTGRSQPKMVLVTGQTNQTELPENMISEFDQSFIRFADLIVRPYFWDPDKPASCYLVKFYGHIEEDDLDRKYGHLIENRPEPEPDPDF